MLKPTSQKSAWILRGGFFFFLVFFSVALSSQTFASDKKAEYETFSTQVFGDSLVQKLQYRLQALYACHAKAPSSEDLEDLPLLNSQIQKVILSAKTAEPQTTEALNLLSQSEVYRDLCQESFQKWEGKLAFKKRAKFLPIKTLANKACLGLEGCEDLAQKILSDIDPYCELRVRADFNGFMDHNACFAAVNLISSSLKAYKYGRPSLTQDIDNLLLEIYKKTNEKKDFDLWELYQAQVVDRKTHASREYFLALLNYFFYSGTSELGYMDWTAEFAFQTSLSNSSTQTLAQYQAHKRRMDLRRDLFAHAQKLKVKIFLKGKDITHWNRHNYVSAFLSCHYANSGNQKLASVFLPRLLGYSYESLDFISHKKAGVSLKNSLQNFKVDTRRYVEGSSFGFEFCQ